MKRIIILLLVCLFVFCGCGEAEDVCTVTFDSQGGSAVETQEVVWGGKVDEPTPPTKNCPCEFDGWYLGEEKWSFIGYSVTEDMTLTAKWAECHGFKGKELEILKGFVSSKYNKTWKDVVSIQKERSNEFDRYDYTITFKDGSSFIGSIWCEFIEN